MTSRICSIVRQEIVEQLGAGGQHRQALGAGDGDVEAVARVEELDVARDLRAGGGGHREEDDGRLLALELVDGPDPDLRHATLFEQLADAAYLGVVGGDDHDSARGPDRVSLALVSV